MLLYLETGEYQYGITQGYGIRVQIHEPGSIPQPEEEGYFVPASMETSIGLKKVHSTYYQNGIQIVVTLRCSHF